MKLKNYDLEKVYGIDCGTILAKDSSTEKFVICNMAYDGFGNEHWTALPLSYGDNAFAEVIASLVARVADLENEIARKQ